MRLAREEALEGTFTAGIRRVLVPVRPRPEPMPNQTIQAWVVNRLAAAHPVSATLFAVVDPGEERTLAAGYLRRVQGLYEQPVSSRMTASADPVATILREVEGDYDLVVIGTPQMSPTSSVLFGPVIDELVKLSPCPTLVVRAGGLAEGWKPRRILVPTNGSPAARAATDLAFALAGPDTEVTGLHVMVPTRVGLRSDFASDITSEMAVVGESLNLRTATAVEEAPDVETGILRNILTNGVDLLVLGTHVRAGTTRLHLGPRVEYIARHAPCPVLILNT